MRILKNNLFKLAILLLKKTEILSAISCRLVQLTGKHPKPIHPKHLVKVRPAWYLKYINKKSTVLDVGCNNAQHTIRTALVAKKVFGFDRDPRVLNLARYEISRLNIKNVFLKIGDAQNRFPFRNDYFDVVIFLDVFEHLTNRNISLFEIRRVLKPKGKLLISVPKSDTSWKKIQKKLGMFYYSDPDHKIEFTESEIRLVLKKAKFKLMSIQPVTLDTPWVGFIDLVGGFSLTLYRILSQWRRNRALKNPENSIGFEIVCHKI